MQCFTCRQDFADDDLRYTNGRYGVCLMCIAKANERHIKKKAKDCIVAKERRKYRTNMVNEYKVSYGCKLCGYNKCAEALHFHHRDPTHKIKAVGIMVKRGYSIERIIAEMRKCDVLCANCHAELHSNG
jgi:hypothetical protein